MLLTKAYLRFQWDSVQAHVGKPIFEVIKSASQLLVGELSWYVGAARLNDVILLLLFCCMPVFLCRMT